MVANDGLLAAPSRLDGQEPLDHLLVCAEGDQAGEEPARRSRPERAWRR